MKKLLFLIPLSLVTACGKEQGIAPPSNKSRTIEEKLGMIRYDTNYQPWKNLGKYVGIANTAEELFTPEERKEFEDYYKRSEQAALDNPDEIMDSFYEMIPPKWNKIHLINTNILPFEETIWKTQAWQDEYKKRSTGWATNLKPEEATTALLEYQNEHRSFDLFVLYHYGEQGAIFNQTNTISEEIFELHRSRNTLEEMNSNITVNSFYLGREDVQTYQYLFSKGFKPKYFYHYDYNGVPYFRQETDAERLKFLVKNGVDLNKIPHLDSMYKSNADKKVNQLYAEAFYNRNPFIAHLFIALGYTNEAYGFQLTNTYIVAPRHAP